MRAGFLRCLRNTPTCVGKTPIHELVGMAARKHPHMRGEDESPNRLFNGWGETPPHAWGRRNGLRLLHSQAGNTPTCVGKTRYALLKEHVHRKHPHMRGEDPERSLNFFLHTWY